MKGTVSLFGIFLIPIVMAQNSGSVKKSDAEVYSEKAVFSNENITPIYKASHKVELIIDLNNMSSSQLKANEKRKHRRERFRKRKDRGGKFSRAKNKSPKPTEDLDKHALRNSEKINLVRNKTIEILKNGLKILSAEENHRRSGNKSFSRVNETVLEKMLSSAAEEKNTISAARFKVADRLGIYENVPTSEKKLFSVPVENFVKNRKQNRTDDFEYEYDLLADVQTNGTRRHDRLDHENLDETVGTLLEQIVTVLKNLTNCSGGRCPSESRESVLDPCEKWLSCKDGLEQAFAGDGGDLPSCPCTYPSAIFYEDNIWDKKHKKFFRWRDASSETERLDIYKPGAAYCIRSLLARGSSSASSQQCCYDRSLKLITRGSGAGTINFISPDVSRKLHYTVDILPWRLCKGDFTRYNAARNPNNGNKCLENPDEQQYQLQVKLSKIF